MKDLVFLQNISYNFSCMRKKVYFKVKMEILILKKIDSTTMQLSFNLNMNKLMKYKF